MEGGHKACLLLLKALLVGFRHWVAGGKLQTEGIDLLAILPEAVAEVRAGGQSRLPHVADHVSLFYPCAATDAAGKPRHMQVLRGVGAVVAYFDVVAVAARISRGHHGAGPCRPDWGAGGGGIIGAQVRDAAAMHRVHPVARVPRTDARVLQRRAQKRLPHALAIFVKVIRALRVRIVQRGVRAPGVLEARGQNAPQPYRLIVDVILLVHDGELIAPLNAVEVDLPGQDVGQLYGQMRAGLRSLQGSVRRAFDDAMHGALARFHVARALCGCDAIPEINGHIVDLILLVHQELSRVG